MIKSILRTGAGLLVLGALATPVVAQVTSEHQKTQSGLRRTMRLPDDPAIPSIDEINAETPLREFIESFLVAMAREEGTAVYDVYLHPRYQSVISRDDFGRRMDEMMDVLGPIEKIGVAYLRRDNAEGNLPEAGYADYAAAFRRDPRVAIRVEYERTGGDPWKITAYSVTSAALDRFYASRAAAMADEEAAADEDTEDDGPRSPDR